MKVVCERKPDDPAIGLGDFEMEAGSITQDDVTGDVTCKNAGYVVKVFKQDEWKSITISDS